MLEKTLHVHFVHDIQAVFSFRHVQNWFDHELEECEDVVLFLKIQAESGDQIVLKQRALGDQTVDLLLLNFPADSVDQQRDLDGVELTDNWILLHVLAVQDLLVDVYQLVHLLDAQYVEVLVQEEELDLVKLDRVSERLHQDVHHALVHILGRVEVERVNQNRDLERIILQAGDEQVHKLLVRDFVLLGLDKLLIVVLLTVHIEHDVDVFSRNEEPLSVVLSDSLFDCVVDHNLFVVGLVIPPVSTRFERECFREEQQQVHLGRVPLEREPDELVVPLGQELERILISQLDEPALPEDLRVHYAQVVVDGLVEDHVVHQRVDLLTDRSDLLNAVHVDELQELVDLLVAVDLVYKGP